MSAPGPSVRRDCLGIPRFDAKVDRRVLTPVVGECWIWTGGLDHGYGRFRGHSRDGVCTRLAHRFAYERAVGPVPAGLQLDHLCHTLSTDCQGGETCAHRSCVNPAHLEAVTPQVNTLRGNTIPARHAKKTHCPQGHPLVPGNLYIQPSRPKTRDCLTCKRQRDGARDRRKKVS